MAGTMVHCAEGHFCGEDFRYAERHLGGDQEPEYIRAGLVNMAFPAGPSEVMEIGASRPVPVPFCTGKYPL